MGFRAHGLDGVGGAGISGAVGGRRGEWRVSGVGVAEEEGAEGTCDGGGVRERAGTERRGCLSVSQGEAVYYAVCESFLSLLLHPSWWRWLFEKGRTDMMNSPSRFRVGSWH